MLREVCKQDDTRVETIDKSTELMMQMIRERDSETIPLLVIKTFDILWFMDGDIKIKMMKLDDDCALDDALLSRQDCDRIAGTMVTLASRGNINPENLEVIVHPMHLLPRYLPSLISTVKSSVKNFDTGTCH